MLNSDVLERRKQKARLLKSARELYGIRFEALRKSSGLSCETMYRLEKGEKTWTIDVELTYITALNKMIDLKQDAKPFTKWPERPAILQQPKVPLSSTVKEKEKV